MCKLRIICGRTCHSIVYSPATSTYCCTMHAGATCTTIYLERSSYIYIYSRCSLSGDYINRWTIVFSPPLYHQHMKHHPLDIPWADNHNCFVLHLLGDLSNCIYIYIIWTAHLRVNFCTELMHQGSSKWYAAVGLDMSHNVWLMWQNHKCHSVTVYKGRIWLWIEL